MTFQLKEIADNTISSQEFKLYVQETLRSKYRASGVRSTLVTRETLISGYNLLCLFFSFTKGQKELLPADLKTYQQIKGQYNPAKLIQNASLGCLEGVYNVNQGKCLGTNNFLNFL